MNTATVGMAVTPTVMSTFVSHYFNRKPLKERPTAHLSYDEGLHLIRSFLTFASHHTVEDLQAFTAQWVPHPQWVKVDDVEIPEEKTIQAADAIQEQLGPDGIRLVGGRNWWQWRRPKSPLAAEWIEMRSDYNDRKKNADPGKRVMLYVHGGAYFFGSVDEHRYQMQRHARKLKARVFAPKYRLAPQFPFPCGLQDCLAAYLYLLTIQDPTTIILAGDSAGGGMVLSLLVILRDRGLPLPAGAILISPWVDLTHSFPSVAGEAPLDYIPQNGFHHKPSKAWPPLNAEEHALLREQIAKNTKPGHTKLMKPATVDMKRRSQDLAHLEASTEQENGEGVDRSAEPEMYNQSQTLSIEIDGKVVQLKDQIQMYTTNELLAHPMVSPIMQPTLGGLPPLLIMVGGGEILRDEQIYLAHKCANPNKYTPSESLMHESARAQLARFKPTDVQLQVWDDLCHVAPTLSFTRPAKFMYRSIAQFGAWALARAQKTEIDILDDDDISIISSSGSDSDGAAKKSPKASSSQDVLRTPTVGRAGDELPPFKNHMIRQQISRHGTVTPLAPEEDLISCNMPASGIGVIKEGPVRKWLVTRNQWDTRFGSARAKIHKKRLKEMVAGYEHFDGETPPPSALAGRRKAGYEMADYKKRKSMGLALWSLWGSKHDEMTMNREQEADKVPEIKVATDAEGAGARSQADIRKQEKKVEKRPDLLASRSPSRRRIVKDEHQVAEEKRSAAEEASPLAVLMAQRTGKQAADDDSTSRAGLLGPDYVPPETGATGKRPIVEGIAVPFTLNKEAETASMITLTSYVDTSRVASPVPFSPHAQGPAATSAAAMVDGVDRTVIAAQPESPPTPRASSPKVPIIDDMAEEEPVTAGTPRSASPAATPKATSPNATPTVEKANGFDTKPVVMAGGVMTQGERPPLETFVTAQEELPRLQ
ncbi:putative Alpha/beta hydrolase fold-3 domain-containing protein [Seiridium cardinale]|uniref:Alpha/beta hydrolase fold-3 domain-containing protein n=1 Tax=Seiridium cardinale TaxID=138064 RepID=A0ABR2XGL5_9PEZI